MSNQMGDEMDVCIEMEGDDELDELMESFSNQKIGSKVEDLYEMYGENCLCNLEYDILEEMYAEIFGEEPGFNMTKSDVIYCIQEYYGDDELQ